MTDKQIIIDENKINPNDWLEPYKPIPACEIKDCNELVYCGDGILGCRIAEDGLVCDDFNNDDECCMYRQLEYYKEALKRKEQECEELKKEAVNLKLNLKKVINLSQKKNRQCYQFLADIKQLKHQHQADKGLITSTGKMNYQLLQEYDKLKTALTEIRDIAEKTINSSDCYERMYGGMCARPILQKISEVLE